MHVDVETETFMISKNSTSEYKTETHCNDRSPLTSRRFALVSVCGADERLDVVNIGERDADQRGIET